MIENEIGSNLNYGNIPYPEDKFLLVNDDKKDVAFVGKLLAKSSSYSDKGPASKQWQELILYKTEGGSYICQTIENTILPDEYRRSQLFVTESLSELIDHMGHRSLAKEIYTELSIDTTLRAD